MSNALRSRQRELSVREKLNNLFKVPPSCVPVLGVLQMPIGHRIEGEGDVQWSVSGLGAETLNGQFGTGNVFEVFGLNLRQQHQSFEICGKAVQLFANFGDGFQVSPLLLPG